MEIRDILLFLYAGGPNDAAMELATRWAGAFGAAVTGCCLCADPRPSNADCYAIGYVGAADVLDRRQRKIESLALPVEAAFRAAAAAAGVIPAWTTPDPNERADDLALRARFFDLAVVARAPSEDHPARELAEALALRSGGPCVIAPQDGSAQTGERIVVAWNGSAQARRAIDDSLPFLQRAKAVQLLVLGDSPALLDHCHAEQMARRLARHRVNAELRITPSVGRDGESLAAACAAFDADVLVMGAYSRSRASEVVLGGATRAVLDDFPIPVLMSH